MRRQVAAALVVALIATPVVALAQEGGPGRPQPGAPAGQPSPTGAAATPSPDDLGVSLSRIRRELREIPPVESPFLRYDFHVQVYGQAPKVDFFKDFDLSPNGPVRYGGMTHAEFLDVVTPQAFRAPPADLLGLASFLIRQIAKKKLGDNGSDK